MKKAVIKNIIKFKAFIGSKTKIYIESKVRLFFFFVRWLMKLI